MLGFAIYFIIAQLKKMYWYQQREKGKRIETKKKKEREKVKKGGREVVAQNEPNEPEAKDEENIKQFALGIEG